MNRSRSTSSSKQPPQYLNSSISSRRSRLSKKPPLVKFNRLSKIKRKKYERIIKYTQDKNGLSPISEGDESMQNPSSKKSEKNSIGDDSIQLKRKSTIRKSIVKSKNYTVRSFWKGIKNVLGLRKSKSAM